MTQISKKVSLIHRSRVDIMADILRAAKEGATKTHIMYESYLSFKQVTAYLDYLIDRDLLAALPNKTQRFQMLRLTKKGKDFLQAYSNLKRLLV